MSQQDQIFEIKGLHTYSSDIAGVPPGSLAIARNINLSRLNLAEPRRGFDTLANLPLTSDRASKMFFYSSSILVHYGAGGVNPSTTLALYGSGAFTSKGTISAPTNATSIRSTSMNQNLYLTSSAGIYKLDATTNSIYTAGTPNALHATLALTNGTNLAVVQGFSVSYRWVLVRKDANKNIVVGGVSSKATITNPTATAATRDVTLTCYLPSSVDSTYYAQIYRTTNAAIPAPNGEEFQLVLEHSITASEVSAGFFTETDITPDALIGGATLYVSPTQQGIGNNNAIPPLARDITSFKNIAFYADVEGFHRFGFTLLACGVDVKQLNTGDTITIASGATTEIYTAGATESVATKTFQIDAASASPSTRIDNTVKSLINVINRVAGGLVYATIETSSATDLPGKVSLQSRTLGSAAFTVASARGATDNAKVAFNPNLPTTPGVNTTSSNSVYRNGLMYSKVNEPEAVPLLNVFFVGSSDDPIKRIVALKDSLLIFKEKDGVFRLSGTDKGSFQITLLDSTAKLVAADSVQVLNGLVYGLFESGICEVSDSNVQIISQPIKDKLLSLFGSALTAVKTYTFGIGYETDGKYILALPSNSSDTYATQQLVYDVFGGTWVSWDVRIRAGGVNTADGLLYAAAGDTSRIRTERKLYDSTDFADFEANSTLSVVAGTTLTLTGTDAMSVGDVLDQANLLPAYITSVNISAGTVTVDLAQAYDTAITFRHFKAINVEIQWNRETSGNPAGFKHYSEINLPFKRAFIGAATVQFSSDTNPSVNSVAIAGTRSQGSWGAVAWGSGVWGGASVSVPTRLGVPRTSSRCNGLSVNFSQSVAFSDFQLSGLSLTFTPTSTRTAR